MIKNASEGDVAELALAVYVEEIVAHKRVLYVGDPTSAVPERLARTARSVDVVSTRSRARGTRRGGRVSARRWPSVEDEGRWDLVVVPDLPAAGLATDAGVAEAARWLAPAGVLVAGTPDPQGPAGHPSAVTYEALFDLLDGGFEHVRMLGQAPFAGFSVVDFAPSAELEVTFDGSLLEGAGERAVRYYALASDHDVALDAYAVVQVPSGALAEGAEARARGAAPSEARASELSARLREQQDALDAANVHAEEIERELESVRAELVGARVELERGRERAEAARAERDALAGEVRTLAAQVEALSKTESYDEEYARLESALQERGRELGEARAEVERRGVLVRDLVEELREARGEGPSGARPEPSPVARTIEWTPAQLSAALHAQLDEAVGRAVNAEAEKAELAFRLDEVRGELALAERRCAQELDETRRLEAALRGTVRGLNARLAEVIELHQLTQGRLALAEDDRAAAEARNRRLVRELAEAREQLELEIARAEVAGAAREGAPADAAELARLRAVEASAAAREGQLLGALMQSREEAAERGGQRQAREAAALGELEHRIDGMRAGYETRIAELVRELDTVSADAERALVQAGELRSRLEAKERTEAALRGELSGVRLRLADREAAVEALHAASLPPSRVVVAGRLARDAEALAAALEEARAESERLRAELAERVAPGDHAAVLEALAAVRAESERIQRELERAEADVGTRSMVDGDAERLRIELASARDDAERLRAELTGEASVLRARVDELSAALESARRTPATVQYARDADLEVRIGQLSATVAARDALAGRLQRELSDAAERRRALERRIDECAAKLTHTREELESARSVADVRAQEGERELEDLSSRLERSEEERLKALEGLEEARSILEHLAGDLPPARSGGTSGDAIAVRQLRDRIARLDAEAADREVLLRSLTAQLQERDDRLRAVERMGERAGGAEDPRALQQQLLEMEERVARLQEELEHERAARRRGESPPS